MGGFRFFFTLLGLTLRRLRLLPLAGLVLLCCLLPGLLGTGAEAALSRGAAVSGRQLALTAPEGDGVPAILEKYLNNMEDVRQYCQISAMDYDSALAALEEGRAAAVLALPEGFIRTVQQGGEPEVRLIVDSRRPLEGALALWVGQSASDLLAAVQAGIYAVLDAYDAAPPPGLSRDRVVTEINMQYVQWVLRRHTLFRPESLSPTESLPIAVHYRLSLLWFLVLSLAPLFAWNFQGAWPAAQARLRWAGRSPLWGYAASLAACGLTAAACVFPALALWTGEASLSLAAASLLCGAFFAAYAALCGTATKTAAGCGGLSLLLSLGTLALSGGIVPPALLPEALRRLIPLSPAAWLRSLTAEFLGFPGMAHSRILLLFSAVLLACMAVPLYSHRVRGQEARL